MFVYQNTNFVDFFLTFYLNINIRSWDKKHRLSRSLKDTFQPFTRSSSLIQLLNISICSYRKISCIVTSMTECRGLLRWYILAGLHQSKYFNLIHLKLELTSEYGLYLPLLWKLESCTPKRGTFIIPDSSGTTKELWRWSPNSLPESWSRCIFWIFHAVLLVYQDTSCKYSSKTERFVCIRTYIHA